MPYRYIWIKYKSITVYNRNKKWGDVLIYMYIKCVIYDIYNIYRLVKEKTYF